MTNAESVFESYVQACQSFIEKMAQTGAVPGEPPGPAVFFGAWKDLAEALGMAAPAAPGAAFDPRQFLAGSLPALGPTREYQEIGQRLIDLTMRFQRLFRDLMEHGASVTRAAALEVQGRITATPAKYYEAWIDAAEREYAQVAHSDGFGALLGEICNVLSEFKLERGRLIERIARHLDLPSRSEVDSLHRQVRTLTETSRRQAAAAPRARASRAPVSQPRKPPASPSNASPSKAPSTARKSAPKSAPTPTQPPKKRRR